MLFIAGVLIPVVISVMNALRVCLKKRVQVKVK